MKKGNSKRKKEWRELNDGNLTMWGAKKRKKKKLINDVLSRSKN